METLAYLNRTSSSLPIGTNQWYFTHSNCTDSGKPFRTLHFHKYVQQPGNFCCNDGLCFTSEFVCDGTFHCDSGEDEDNCALLKLPKYYNKYDPPKEVLVNITIVDIMTINEDDSSFDVYFSMKVKWFDKKLKFIYLKNKDEANIVSEDEKISIWTPNIDFAFLRKFSFHIIWRIGPDKQLLSSISAVSKQDSSSELRSS